MTRMASTPVFVGTFAAVFAAIVAFLLFDVFLAHIDSRESAAHAQSEYRDAQALLAANQPARAADHFAMAVAAERGNVRYALGLGEALLQEGRVTDADSTLKALLDRAENDGAVNLAMAHVMIRENHIDEAKAYYHRAFFGRWGEDSIARRTQARFELIALLTGRGSPRELLAELLPLEDTPPDSVAARRRLGQLFLEAGSPVRAADMFRALVRRDPRDTIARAGLALTDSVIALDPTVRGISDEERARRARELLSRTVAALQRCTPPVASTLMNSAQMLLAASDALAEATRSLAVQLWAERPRACAAATHDDVLTFAQARLAP
jgi:tetratricopeptide (TPR) repeat protein